MLLRLEHREWEEAQAWEREGESGGEQGGAGVSRRHLLHARRSRDRAGNETAGSLPSRSSQPGADRL